MYKEIIATNVMLVSINSVDTSPHFHMDDESNERFLFAANSVSDLQSDENAKTEMEQNTEVKPLYTVKHFV